MGAEVSKQSNLFLPLGKVRMGYPSGEARMGYPSGKLGGGCYSIRINHQGAYLCFLRKTKTNHPIPLPLPEKSLLLLSHYYK